MNENVAKKLDGRRSKDEIQEHIRSTEADLRHTIEEIGRTLSPGEILDAAMHYFKVGPGEFATNLTRSARANPVPLALVGTGLGWLMTSPETRDRVGQASGRARAGAESTRESAQSGAQSLARASRKTADRTRQMARQGRQRARTTVDQEPLLIAAVGLVAGAAVATLLPRSETESEVVGPRGEQVRGRVREAGEEATGQAKTIAGGVLEGARRGAEPEVGQPAGAHRSAPGGSERAETRQPGPEEGPPDGEPPSAA